MYMYIDGLFTLRIFHTIYACKSNSQTRKNRDMFHFSSFIYIRGCIFGFEREYQLLSTGIIRPFCDVQCKDMYIYICIIVCMYILCICVWFVA